MSAIASGRRTASIKNVAAELGISIPLAYRLAHKDQLPVPVIKFPGTDRMVVSREALDAVLAQRKEEDSNADAGIAA